MKPNNFNQNTFLVLLSFLISGFSIAQTCASDIVYDSGVWTGGSGPSNAPDNSATDLTKGVHIKEDVSLSALTNCKCVTVDAGTTLSVNDTYSLTVTDNIILNGDIRMLGNSQLIQTHTGTSQISGTGSFYKDLTPPGTTPYIYNYVSAPVVNVGSSQFSINTAMKDGTTPLNTTNTPLDITFNGAANGENTTPISLSSDWLYKYVNSSSWTRNWTNPLNPTEGFTLKGPGAGTQNYTFVGTPNDGEYTSAITDGNLTLIGNPYPSAIDATTFINDNIDYFDGTLYFWDQKDATDGHTPSGYIAGYATLNLGASIEADGNSPVSGTGGLGAYSYETPSYNIAIGQSFFITGDGDGVITFKNSQRLFEPLGDPNFSFRKAAATPSINFQFEFVDSESDLITARNGLAASFRAGNDFNYQKGWDSELFQNNATAMYFKFVGDDTKYGIAGIQEHDEDIEIPLEITIEKSGVVELLISKTTNFTHENVFLKDIVGKKIYPLSKDLKISFELEAGLYSNRFFITFKDDPALSILKNELSSNDVSTFYNSKTNNILIQAKNETISKVSLYNIQGQEINTWNITNTQESISLPVNTALNGVCILKVITANGSLTKKIILK